MGTEFEKDVESITGEVIDENRLTSEDRALISALVTLGRQDWPSTIGILIKDAVIEGDCPCWPDCRESRE